MRKAQVLPSAEFIQIIHTVQEISSSPTSSVPPTRRLREKYAYNVCPCADPDDDDFSDSQLKQNRPCPKPSRGGAFSLEGDGVRGVAASGGKVGGGASGGRGVGVKRKSFKEKSGVKEAEFVSGQKTPSLPEEELRESPVKAQIKLLREHYNHSARQPATVRCNISLAPPQARVTCPQTRYGSGDGSTVSSAMQSTPYGPDVPQEVVEKGRVS